MNGAGRKPKLRAACATADAHPVTPPGTHKSVHRPEGGHMASWEGGLGSKAGKGTDWKGEQSVSSQESFSVNKKETDR